MLASIKESHHTGPMPAQPPPHTPVIVLTRNCLALSQRCVASIEAQDMPVTPLVFDNGSTDGTQSWLDSLAGVYTWQSAQNRGVTFGWNLLLHICFDSWELPEVFVVNNDVVLPRWWCRTLRMRAQHYDLGFLSGNSVDTLDEIADPPEPEDPTRAPDFSAFYMRRDVWQAVGEFDYNMVNYSSDQDYHIRAHRAGVDLMKTRVPFYHERSSTAKHATKAEREELRMRADLDRANLRAKWGCEASGPSYDAMFDHNLWAINRGAR